MNAEEIFTKIRKSGNKYVVITDNESWKDIIKGQNGYFFCIRGCRNHNDIKNLIKTLNDFDLDMIVLCDRCYNSPRERMEFMAKMRKRLSTSDEFDNISIINA